jgi:hypothetical protein
MTGPFQKFHITPPMKATATAPLVFQSFVRVLHPLACLTDLCDDAQVGGCVPLPHGANRNILNMTYYNIRAVQCYSRGPYRYVQYLYYWPVPLLWYGIILYSSTCNIGTALYFQLRVRVQRHCTGIVFFIKSRP